MSTESITNQAWYLVYTKPKQEQIALDNLERQGYRAYLPRVCNHKVRLGRVKALLEPMFPRYLFINLSIGVDDWGPIRSTLGVSGLVRFGGRAATVPTRLIKALMERANEDGVIDLPQNRLEKGQKVIIRGGAMEGVSAVFEARTSSDRVYLLLDIAGITARISVEEHQIEIDQ